MLELSAWRKASNTCGSIPASMPCPVSRTTRTRESLVRCEDTSIRPPDGVNFTEFIKRFHTTCCSRSGAPSIGSIDGSSVLTSITLFAVAAGRTVSRAASTTSLISIRSKSSRIRPALMRDKSMRSSISRLWAEALRTTALMARIRVASSKAPPWIRRAQPKMALRGVRSSWDTVARSSSFARLSISASWRASWSCLSNTARGISDRRDGDRHVEESTILGNSYGLEVIDTLTSPDAREHPILFGSPIGGNDQRDVSSDRFLGRPSKGSLRRWIPGCDDAVAGLADDDVVGRLHDRGQLPRRHFVLSPFRDVARDLRGTRCDRRHP